jgi:heme-degrading monooxygenase HmoA
VHLAQVNIALPREPLDSELLRDFVAALDPVNARADTASGFVWRLQTDAGDATGVSGFGDERLIVNMSVWESLEALRAFVYHDRSHLAVLRRRREWFVKHVEAFQVLWWVAEGHIPSVAEAEERLELLRRLGPTPAAFTFTFSTVDRNLCPA